MSEAFVYSLRFFISAFPYGLMFLVLFDKFRRFRSVVQTLIVIGAVLIPSVVIGIAAATGSVTEIGYNFFGAGSGVALAALGWLSLKKVRGRLYAYVALLIMQIAIFVNGTMIYLQTLTDKGHFLYWILYPCAYIVLVPMTITLRKLVEPLICEYATHPLWLKLSIPASISTVSMFCYFNYAILERRDFELWVLLVFLLFATSLISVNMVALGVVIDAIRSEEYKSQLKTADQLLELQKTQYRLITESIESAKRARHDLKHQLTVIEGLINEESSSELVSCVNEFKKTMPPEIDRKLSDSYAANCIAGEYAQRAVREGVDFEATLLIGEQSTLTDLEIAIMLGNCLENAFEAVSKLPEEKRRISANSTRNGNMLTFVVSNTYDGTAKTNVFGAFLSRKREYKEIGIGLDSIQRIAEKHGGVMKIEQDKERFTVSVMLNVF